MMWQHSFNFLSHYMMPDGTYPTTDDRWNDLTADAWVSGPYLAPEKMILSQKFRYLMRCKKYVNKICLPCLISELFVTI